MNVTVCALYMFCVDSLHVCGEGAFCRVCFVKILPDCCNRLLLSCIAGGNFKRTWREASAVCQGEIGWRGLWLRVFCQNNRPVSSLEVSFMWCSYHWSETCGHSHPEQEASGQDGASFTPNAHVHQAREQDFGW